MQVSLSEPDREQVLLALTVSQGYILDAFDPDEAIDDSTQRVLDLIDVAISKVNHAPET